MIDCEQPEFSAASLSKKQPMQWVSLLGIIKNMKAAKSNPIIWDWLKFLIFSTSLLISFWGVMII